MSGTGTWSMLSSGGIVEMLAWLLLMLILAGAALWLVKGGFRKKK